MAINGSIEIVRGNESIGVTGSEWEPADVPTVLRNLHGIRDMKTVTPAARPTGRTPLHQWSGVDTAGQSVKVMLWKDVPYEETYAAKIGPRLAEESEG